MFVVILVVSGFMVIFVVAGFIGVIVVDRSFIVVITVAIGVPFVLELAIVIFVVISSVV